LYIERNTDGTIGGSYYSLLYLLQGLDKTVYEPHVVFFEDNVLVPEFKKVTQYVYIQDDKTSYRRRKTRLGRYLHLWFADIFLKYWQMKDFLNRIKPDLVHLNNGYSQIDGWVLACSHSKVKIISHDRGTPYPCSIRTKFFSRYLDAIISVSESYRNNVIDQGLKVKRACRVYNGLDMDKVMRSIDGNRLLEIRRELHIVGGNPVVGIVGNVDSWKGQMVVVKAINNIRKNYPNIKCLVVGAVCAGAENYQQELVKYVADNSLGENILFTGFRKDSIAVMNLLDVLIHASVEPEPFARVILEGMALGKPIIGTNSGGTPEQIIDGLTGLLVPMNDHNAMAEALCRYLSDMKKAKEMGDRGRRRLIEEFSIKRMVRETEKIYDDVFSS
jgi:glycosyltransferase involved in cell wall biosynthesis